ncbi:hypothetical protein AGDE_16207 [Angomonas deanei]|uniref:Phosphatidylinositol 3- and 4-kinase, putative n=1 Tax=Angomonas deanei TaxID=59799 RepID=A0A7G2C1Z9_9TRYP|nr:hypothetical protein AGDE_16207 [Angomonas deanei]CAD2212753.1 Phosphatidylinositol 3- and 4-kinase, putative [Angomonas deanei]|eukprot:EPY17530.1 hypothetical protein AGDE_16207 [Angomonas deanei]
MVLKHKDDLRQDALIQSFFETSNALLRMADQTTFQNNNETPLQIYTYPVVPLSPTCGVLHYIEDTIGFGEYITGNINEMVQQGKHSGSKVMFGAHGRYFPEEMNTLECRTLLDSVPKDKPNEKKNMLLYIYRNFTPAMHYFFLEEGNDNTKRFVVSSPQDYYQRLQAYTSSVALNSLLGYTIGLGDRHASNLLLHEKNYKMILIDFGIAFDQSKALFIPETIPFRLTRNVMDGFGVRGTAGKFYHYSSHILAVLKREKELCLSILRTLVYDPLTRWSLRAGEQNNNNHKCLPARGDAERVISKINEKLDSCNEEQTNQAQIHKLCQEAQSVPLLSQLFVGWSPWV